MNVDIPKGSCKDGWGGGLGRMLSGLRKAGFFGRVSSVGWSMCQVSPDVLAHPQETCKSG